MPQTDASVAERLDGVRGRIRAAAIAAGRDPHGINLIAVSKTFDASRIEPALGAGHRQFGENRVQEALAKWPELKARHDGVTLHLIGPLQTNKVRDAIGLFDVIHTLDRMKLARALAKEMERQDRRLPVFVEINTGAEPQKAGILPEETDAFLAELAPVGLDIVGLMCIPPLGEEPSPHFALLKSIAERNGLSRLSMGMSHDFEAAIRFGATDVRVGTAIFGERGAHQAKG